jgi:predicted MFS family arabinose efflux permease
LLPKLFGGPYEPVLRPILAVTVTGVTGQYAFFGFFALYALERLHMREASVGLLLLCATVFGMAAGFVLGRVSDAVGRRPLIVIGSALQAVLALALALAPPSIPLAVAVVTLMSLAGPLRYGPIGALIADVIPEERREAAYAANRIAYNVAAVAGPLASPSCSRCRFRRRCGCRGRSLEAASRGARSRSGSSRAVASS